MSEGKEVKETKEAKVLELKDVKQHGKFTIGFIDKPRWRETVPISKVSYKDNIIHLECGPFTVGKLPGNEELSKIMTSMIDESRVRKNHFAIQAAGKNGETISTCYFVTQGAMAVILGLLAKVAQILRVFYDATKQLLTVIWQTGKALFDGRNGTITMPKSIAANFTDDDKKRFNEMGLAFVTY